MARGGASGEQAELCVPGEVRYGRVRPSEEDVRPADTTFPTDLQHAIGHFSLFALLGGLALATFPNLRARPWRYAGLLALAGLGQECFQLLFKQRPINFDDGRDLVVDLAGLALAFVLVQIWEWWRREA